MIRLLPVIPALNAARQLARVIEALEEGVRSRLILGGVLSDGGSADGTAALARRYGFHVVTGAAGRGGQLRAGAEAASRIAGIDDWYLFLHADTRLQPGWSAEAARFMADNADRHRAGAFRFALDDTSGAARRLERFVGVRSNLLALPYGDQGLLISRRFYETLGGYQPWPLFEDVDLVRRIGRQRLSILRSKAVTSAERFLSEGYGVRSARNLVLLGRYFLGASPVALARAYRRR